MDRLAADRCCVERAVAVAAAGDTDTPRPVALPSRFAGPWLTRAGDPRGRLVRLYSHA